MLDGLILVALLAGLCTFGVTKLRRRLGAGVTSRTWGITFVVAVLVVLALWAAGHN